MNPFARAENDIAAIATIAAAGATKGDVFFAAKGDATIATLATFDFNYRTIDEHSYSLAAFLNVLRRELEQLVHCPALMLGERVEQ